MDCCGAFSSMTARYGRSSPEQTSRSASTARFLNTVTFRNANVKQEPPRVGAVWLYRELYRHKSGRGYEAHILFEAPAGPVYRKICAAALIDTRIICDEIEFA